MSIPLQIFEVFGSGMQPLFVFTVMVCLLPAILGSGGSDVPTPFA
jgi:hypothetical protein